MLPFLMSFMVNDDRDKATLQVQPLCNVLSRVYIQGARQAARNKNFIMACLKNPWVKADSCSFSGEDECS